MTNPENKNLLLLEGRTEIHINPKNFKGLGLRELLRFQIFAEPPVEISLVANGKKLVLPPNTMRDARRLFGENRKLFLDKTTQAMRDAEEIIILKRIGINRNGTNKPHDPFYDNVFRNFINTSKRKGLREIDDL